MGNNLIYFLFVLAGICFSCVQGYSVVGNKILDANGNPFLIRGVDRPSLEWSSTGENLSLEDYTNMKAWGANVVRVALNQDYWFASTAYQAIVAQQEAWITSLGMGVIFDLHWNNGGQQVMADVNSITFWTQMAIKFKNNPLVMFELYNEPHDLSSWSVWLNGQGNIAGMQQLYNAVRDTGANNVVIVGGLNYAFDLSGVSNGYAVVGTNIAYASHPYDFPGKQPGDWDVAFGNLAATYPVILTEFGEYCHNNNYVQKLLAYAQSKQIHWTAWAWYPKDCDFPSIIADWSGTPLGPVGNLVKSYLGGSGSGSATTGGSTVTTGGTTTTTSGSTTGAPPAGNSLAVYTDSLQNGFQDWSWSTAKSPTNSTHAHTGSYAFKFALQKFEGIYFHTDNYFQLGSYASVQFYIFSPLALPASIISVLLFDTLGNRIGATPNLQSALAANTWTFVSVPISAFGVSGTTAVSGVAIQGLVQDYSGDVWVDDVYLVAPSSTPAPTPKPTLAPTQKPTSVPTPQPTLTPTPKPTQKPTPAPSPAPTPKPTPAPTRPPTQQPTAAPTPAPTSKPTSAPTPAPTQKPTPAPTPKPTVAPTSAPTSPPTPRPTPAPTPKPTSAPTPKATAAPTPKPSGCDASNIVITQTQAGSWVAGDQTITQFQVSIANTCTTKALVALTLTASAWNPFGIWGASASGTTITLADYLYASPGASFTQFGYQNYLGQASFTVAAFTFQ